MQRRGGYSRTFGLLAGAAIVLALCLSPSATAKEAYGKVTDVCIASDTGNGYASNESKTIEYEDDVTLYAVARARTSDGFVYFTEADSLVLDGKPVQKRSLKEFPEGFHAEWFTVENTDNSYSNASQGRDWDHWDEIGYTEKSVGSGFKIEADVAPSILEPVYLDGKAVGTMRYRLVLTDGEEAFETPGSESRFNGGVSNSVHRISRKGNTGNDILDNGFSMCNNPYIWASHTTTGKDSGNQAENFIGADCADFCVAAARLSGHNLTYTSSSGLATQGDVVVSIDRIDNGVYQTRGEPVSTSSINPGDFVVWRGHAGIFVEDTEPLGVLDDTDKVLHTLFHEPRVEELGEAYGGRFKIVRVGD